MAFRTKSAALFALFLTALAPSALADFVGLRPELRFEEDQLRFEAKLHGPWEFILEEEAMSAGLRSPAAIATHPWPSAARELEVPGCFTAQVEDLRNFVGAGWYRIRLLVDEFPENVGLWAIIFDGIARESKVYIDGRLIEDGRFSYTPLGIPLTGRADPVGRAELLLAIRVSNEIPDFGIPDREWDGWWNHAGIFRDVTLYGYRHEQHFGPIRVRTHLRDRQAGPSGGWMVGVVAAFYESDRGQPRPENFILKGTLNVPSAETGGEAFELHDERDLDRYNSGLLFELPGTAATWTPSSPTLGRLKLELFRKATENEKERLVARRVDAVGLRDVWIDGSRLIMNGIPMRLFGFSYHEVLPETGYTVSRAQLREDLTRMKEFGANFLRTGHYPPHPYVPELANELGLVIWEEIPAWKTSAETLDRQALRGEWLHPYLYGMIMRDLHHPSVLFWGVGNEFDTTDPRVRSYIKDAVSYVNQMDNSRFAVYASDRRLNDIALDLVDIVAVNEYYGWYYGDPGDLAGVLDALHEKYPEKPILVSEFGAGGILGLKQKPPESRRDYSEGAQARFLLRHIEQIFAPERADYMLGGCLWLWADFDDPHRTEKHHPKAWHGVNTKGVLTREREKKESYEAVRERVAELELRP